LSPNVPLAPSEEAAHVMPSAAAALRRCLAMAR
jgi:hypothetical protein